MKPIVIYHANCTDGFGAAYAAWRALGDDVEYIDAHYGELDDPATLEERFGSDIGQRDVYILDFSLKRPAMDWLFDKAQLVVWLDHHKTAFEMWCDIPNVQRYHLGSWPGRHIMLDNNKSGALLAWEYFHQGGPVPLVIQHIDDRDRWQWKLPGSAAIHMALWNHKPWSFAQWDDLLANPGDLREMGLTLLGYQERQVEASVEKARPCAINPAPMTGAGIPGLAVNTPTHISEVGNELAKKSGTYGLVWYFDGSQQRAMCSLRSIGDYDVSAIAKVFGGGGHKNAAGFQIDMQTLLEWMK